MDAGNNSDLGKGKQPRHTLQQIQRLEAFFMNCPNPGEKDRRQLSRELGLEPKQVKFWFQNKRNQAKVHSDRADNNGLRLENERMHYENTAFAEIMKNVLCPSCDPHQPISEEARKSTVAELKLENARMKEAHEKHSNMISSRTGRPISHFLSLSPDAFARLLNSPVMNFLGQEGASPFHSNDTIFTNSQNTTVMNYESVEISEKDKEAIVQCAFQAMNELAELFLVHEHLWVISPTHGGYVLHREYYSKFSPMSSQLNIRNSRIESSKDSTVVSATASNLVELFLDMNKWADLFPTIVMETKIMETLDTGSLGGSLHLMYKRTHILSPLVAPREFFFFRYCQQLDPGTWLIVDASYDFFREIHELPPTCCWRFPSGVMIQSLPDGRSKVTWVDHVEFNESQIHPLYRNLLCSAHGFGARRWLSTFQRMIERSLHSVVPGSMSSQKLDGDMILEGRTNIMTLTHRMMKNFSAVLSMPSRLDLSESTDCEVGISLRNNNELGQPHGIIVAASTSVWLPLTFENLFNFLRDENRRPEWDEMFNRSPFNVMAQMSTGTHPGNSISIMQPVLSKENLMWLVQENSIDPLGAQVIFAPIDAEIVMEVINGRCSSTIPILPCGFMISSDGLVNRKGSGDGASTCTSSSSKPCGSLLTLAFQVPGRSNAGSMQSHMDAVSTLNTLLTATVRNLKVALGCTDLE